MWFSKNRNAGFSLTEILVVLVILALTISAFATARPGPSPEMQREAIVSQLMADAAQARAMAIRQGTLQTLAIPEPTCRNSPKKLTFFPSGTTLGTEICFSHEDAEIRLWLDTFTGHLSRIPTT